MLFLLVPFMIAADVYVNADIVTLNAEAPRAQVMVLEDGKFVYVGNQIPEAFRHLEPIDLHGKQVLPGLTDAHAHLIGLGSALERLDLKGISSFEEIIDLAKKKAGTLSTADWILGRGWDQNLWKNKTFPNHDALSQAVPNHPVCLYRVDGHALLLNQKAMDLLNIGPQTESPEGGQILMHDGKPTGVLIDNAMSLVILPKRNKQATRQLILKASRHIAELGLTGVHDAGVTYDNLAAMEELGRENKLPIRLYVMLENEAETLHSELAKGPRINQFNGYLTVRCIKVYADGALGSRGAWLKRAYDDAPGHKGLQVTSSENFDAVLAQAKLHGFQVATHAIGDQANRFVLDHYKQVFGAELSDRRLRVEHAQIVDIEDIPLFQKLGVIPSMQPTHCTSDMGWAGERVGSDRLEGAYAWRRFLDSGCYIPLGSDFPVEKPTPWDGLYAAVTRQTKAGKPPGGFFADQVLTREEALKGFTIWAARASFQEDILGSIQKGKFADFIVIDRDYFQVPAEEIPKIKVLRTVVGGNTVHQRPNG